MTSKCAECGREFEDTNENAVAMKIWNLYAVVCKPCYLRLKREGKIRIIKKGEKGALI